MGTPTLFNIRVFHLVLIIVLIMLAPPTVWGQVQLGNDIDGSAAGVQAGNDIYGEAANDFSAGNGVGQSLVSISAAGDRVAIGALFNDGNGVDAGHVRTYDLTSITQKYGGGLGTAANPYLIATTDHLIELSNSSGDWGSHFLQTADLTFDATEGNVDWDGDGTVGDAAGFSPIGNGTTRFTGTYDGGGHTIANLYISRGVEPNVGLFGEINGARLHDLGLIAVEVTGFDYVGGLVGSGISNDSISVCYSTGSVVGTGYESTTGGLIGGFYSGTIESCYSSCMVIGGTRVGGLVSRLSVSTANLKFSYSTGHVTGDLIVGGLVASNNGAVTDCYSTGQVTGSSFVGGLVGMNSGTITACFWDEDTSGQATSAAGEGKSTAEMKTYSTFATAGWDFVSETANGTADVWDMDQEGTVNNGYPILSWQPGADLITQKYGGGLGTAANPYLIATTDHLIELSNSSGDWGSHFLQTADLTFDATEANVDWDGDGTVGDTDDASGFSPIGVLFNQFTGSYDGGGHTIENLYISRVDESRVGLFGDIRSSSIKDLGLVAVDVLGESSVGGLIGVSFDDSTISDCYTTGTVSGVSSIGGLIGNCQGSNGRVDNCYSNASVTVSCPNGFCYESIFGGLIGYMYRDTLSNSYSTGSVAGTEDVGGLVGRTVGCVLFNNYSTGAVSGSTRVGGLVGSVASGSTLTNSYSTGAVSGTTDVGGLIGSLESGTINNCFWDEDTSGQATSAGGTGKTTAHMKTYSTFATAGWDFVSETANGTADVWDMDQEGTVNSGYPILSWQPGADLITQKYGGGLGTAANPYLIATTDHLIELSNSSGDWGSHFLQTADLTFDATEANVDWDGDGTVGDAAGFSPIGNGTTRFTGTYDGGGHTIANLYISRVGQTNVGFFGVISNAMLSNINILGSVSGDFRIGILVGYCLSGASIVDCSADGIVSGISNVGGLIGEFRNATVSRCYSKGSVTGTASNIGGLVGLHDGSIIDCYSSCTVTGQSRVGGLVGENNESIENSFSTGAVSPSSSSIGGLVGTNNSGNITACFWDTQTSGQATSAGGTAKSTAQMKTYSTFATAGWDFVSETANGTADVWDMDQEGTVNNGYPILSWQPSADLIIQKYGGGLGTAANPYLIATTDHLIELSNSSGDWDKHFRQTENINLNGVSLSDMNFSGVYDGNNFTISNYTITGTSDDRGLFRELSSSATVQNLTLHNFNISGGVRVGALAGKATGGSTISNVDVTSVTIDGNWDSGGIVGECGGCTIENSSVDAMSSIDCGNFGGGIVGKSVGSSTYTNLSGNPQMSGSSLGGIVGAIFQNGASFTDCTSQATINGSVRLGGIAGRCYDTPSFTNCSFSGSISGTWNCGGIIGRVDGGTATITNCNNSGSITQTNAEGGGIIGTTDGTANISTSYNTGSINANWKSAGIIGRVNSNSTVTITECYNSGTITSNENQAGGIVGSSAGVSNITESYNTGNITSSSRSGGIIGKVESSPSGHSSLTDCYNTGAITGGYSGGLIGEEANGGSTTVNNCYNAGTVQNDGTNGHILGGTSGTVTVGQNTTSFYDAGINPNLSPDNITGIIPKTTTEMKDLFTFSGAGWGDPWHIDFAQSENSGYPNLNSIGVPVVAGSRSLGIVNTGGGTEGVNWGMANGIMYSLQDAPVTVNAADVGSKLSGTHLEMVGSSLDISGTVSSESSQILYLNLGEGGTIQPGAALDLGGGLYLVGNTRLTLTSSSTSYASLIVDGALTENCGGDCITYERYTNQVGTGTAGGNDLVASPFWNQSFSEFAAANTNLAALNDLRAFGPWDNTAPGFINYSVTTDASTMINPGRGYRAATKADAQDRRLAFTGDVNRSNVFRSITNGSASQWNLLGNPYPAYLSMQDFLTQNGHLFNSNAVAIYGYNGQSTDFYEEINNAVLLAEGDRLMAPGQGFFVAAAEECTDQNPCNVQFATSMMRTGGGDDFINGITPNDPTPYLEVKAITATQSFGTRIYFNAASTAGLDPGYDAALWGEVLPDFALYTHLVAAGEGVPLGIQSLNLTDLENPQLAIPLGIASKSGIPLTLAITDAQLPMGQQVYLLDSLSGDRHLISGLPYTFTPNTDLSGSGRYYLVFAGEQVVNASHDEKTASLESLVIYAPRNREELVIMGSLKSAAQLSLYDMQGRYLTGAALSTGAREQRLPLRQLPGGVYLVQIVSGQGVRAEQILLVK